MHTSRTAFGGAILLTLLLSLVLPASALISLSADAVYDASDVTPAFGQEGRVQVTLSPGDNDITDITIQLSEAQAFIDEKSFQMTTQPADIPVNLQRNGQTFTASGLRRGETITLTFDAYPKSISQREITAVMITVRCIQAGQNIVDTIPVLLSLEDSVWFSHQKAVTEDTSSGYMGMIAILVVLLILLVLVSGFFIRSRRKTEIKEQNTRWLVRMQQLKERLFIARDNPSEIEPILVIIDDYLSESKAEQISKGPKEQDTKKKKNEFEDW